MNRLALAALCTAIAACSSSEDAKDNPQVSQDAGADTSPPDGAVAEAGADGPAVDAPSDDAPSSDVVSNDATPSETGAPFETCEGDCAQTSLTITLGNNTAAVDRAQFGFNAADKGAPTLHIEAHLGGDPACPSTSSPTPDLTVIFGSVPIPTDTTPIENTPVTLLDFTGDLSPNPFDKAMTATLTPVAIKTDPPESAFIAFDVSVTFPNGTMTGHVYATHCDSMDE